MKYETDLVYLLTQRFSQISGLRNSTGFYNFFIIFVTEGLYSLLNLTLLSILNSYDLNREDILVKSLIRGNVEAFESLYGIYSLRLFRFGIKYLKSEIEAEGLVQDVFAKVWEKRSSLKPELSFKSYIFTIAFNLIRKSFKKKSRITEYLQTQRSVEKIDLETTNQIEYQSLMDYLNTLVNQLPEKRREIFLKSRIDDLSVKETAKQLGISPKTVENQLTSAIKFLKVKWEPYKVSIILFFGLFKFWNI